MKQKVLSLIIIIIILFSYQTYANHNQTTNIIHINDKWEYNNGILTAGNKTRITLLNNTDINATTLTPEWAINKTIDTDVYYTDTGKYAGYDQFINNSIKNRIRRSVIDYTQFVNTTILENRILYPSANDNNASANYLGESLVEYTGNSTYYVEKQNTTLDTIDLIIEDTLNYTGYFNATDLGYYKYWGNYSYSYYLPNGTLDYTKTTLNFPKTRYYISYAPAIFQVVNRTRVLIQNNNLQFDNLLINNYNKYYVSNYVSDTQILIDFDVYSFNNNDIINNNDTRFTASKPIDSAKSILSILSLTQIIAIHVIIVYFMIKNRSSERKK